MQRFITINRVKKSEKSTDFHYWQSQPFEKRLETLEMIREEYISWKYATKPGFQRVLTITKRQWR